MCRRLGLMRRAQAAAVWHAQYASCPERPCRGSTTSCLFNNTLPRRHILYAYGRPMSFAESDTLDNSSTHGITAKRLRFDELESPSANVAGPPELPF
ncbi:hypothetical protein EVG20_g8393 [Dentipellis fragilis]|uniref:Uncharacterized protein n=1 Tax=Dentipellis fragilis TaxID=205917 RepID=A0A4Y9Y8R6_9AGAM|nr:hypothetical protein EVG20_g8393 [Dentipellis fragilis]